MARLYDRYTKGIKRICFFVTLLLCFFSVKANELPELGDSSGAYLTPAQEYELGLDVVKELKAYQMLNDDVVVNEYLGGIGHRLVATRSLGSSSYHFFLVNDKTVNAFALPGGFVGINTGLILATESESELASVLAHEVAHVQQRHIARMYEHMGRLRLSTIAGLIASMLLATQSPELAQGAMAATLGGSQQSMINFTRDHEKEADYIGMENLVKAGFDPMGMPGFFHRMGQENRFHGNQVPDFFMTHPVTESRVIVAKTRAQSYPYKQIPDSLQYHLIQARVKFFQFSSAHEASQHFAKQLTRGNYRSKLGTTYGYVLALLAEGKSNQAKPYIEELITEIPAQPLFQLTYAQLELDTGQKQAAYDRLEAALSNHPKNNPLTLALGTLLLKDHRAEKAISLLKKQTSSKGANPQNWKLLSIAYADNNQPLEAHLAQAQFLKSQGDIASALTQIKLAKKISRTPTEKEQIQTLEQSMPVLKKKVK